MKDGKYSKRRRGVSSKALALTLAVMLVIGCAVGGTLAWLNDTTDKVTNTFTTSNIEITLEESKGGYAKEFKMVPGYDIAKDPLVTVKSGSEKCWLFVKVEKKGDFDKYLTFAQNTDWLELDADKYPGVYYYNDIVDASTADQTFYFLAGKGDGDLKNGYVTVNSTVIKTDMETVNAATQKPQLIFTAYAAQAMQNNTTVFTAAQAWENNFATTPNA